MHDAYPVITSAYERKSTNNSLNLLKYHQCKVMSSKVTSFGIPMQCVSPASTFHIVMFFSLHLSALGLPGQVGEVCPLIPNLEKSLEEIMELAESGVRYTQMPHVMEVANIIPINIVSVLPVFCRWIEFSRCALSLVFSWC